MTSLYSFNAKKDLAMNHIKVKTKFFFLKWFALHLIIHNWILKQNNCDVLFAKLLSHKYLPQFVLEGYLKTLALCFWFLMQWVNMEFLKIEK